MFYIVPVINQPSKRVDALPTKAFGPPAPAAIFCVKEKLLVWAHACSIKREKIDQYISKDKRHMHSEHSKTKRGKRLSSKNT